MFWVILKVELICHYTSAVLAEQVAKIKKQPHPWEWGKEARILLKEKLPMHNTKTETSVDLNTNSVINPTSMKFVMFRFCWNYFGQVFN